VSSRSQSRGLLSPHHLGHPHHRERFFIVACRRERLASDSRSVDALRDRALARAWPFPGNFRSAAAPAAVLREREVVAEGRLREIISSPKTEAERDALRASQLSADRVYAVRHWEKLLNKLKALDSRERSPTWRRSFPSFPIWGYELDPWNWYPADIHPSEWITSPSKLRARREGLMDSAAAIVRSSTNGRLELPNFKPSGDRAWRSERLSATAFHRFISELPSYVRERKEWPDWKMSFIRRNREFAIDLWTAFARQPEWFRDWLDELFGRVTAPSNQKLEWNCKGAELTLHDKILSFRPSGVRVKRLVHVPALVAISTTQVPVVPKLNADESVDGVGADVPWRHLLPSEGLQLQGFPSSWCLPSSRDRSFTCLGNAVHAQVVSAIFESWFGVEQMANDAAEQQSSLFNVAQLRSSSATNPAPPPVACSA
jgi:DNA (cytosine-5)-methyltransferase 1